MEEKLEQLLSEEGFVEKLMACETAEQAQALFAERDVDVSLSQLKDLSAQLQIATSQDDELDEEMLDIVAGGATVHYLWSRDLIQRLADRGRVPNMRGKKATLRW